MSDFFKRGIIIVLVLLVIYFLLFYSLACLKIVFPKLPFSKCPDYYDISKCNDISCCVLKPMKYFEKTLDASKVEYFERLGKDEDDNGCGKKIIKIHGSNYNPNEDTHNKKELCKWAKSKLFDNDDQARKLKYCYVPWDGITNGLNKDGYSLC